MFVSRFETTHGETWFSVRMRPVQVYRTSNLLSEFNSVRIYSRRTFLRNVIDSLSFNNSKYYSRSLVIVRNSFAHQSRHCSRLRKDSRNFRLPIAFPRIRFGIFHSRVDSSQPRLKFSTEKSVFMGQARNFRIPNAFTRLMARIFDS